MLVNNQLQTTQKLQELSNKFEKFNLKVSDVDKHNRAEVSEKFTKDKPICMICSKKHLTINCWFFPKVKNLQYRGNGGANNRVHKNYNNS